MPSFLAQVWHTIYGRSWSIESSFAQSVYFEEELSEEWMENYFVNAFNIMDFLSHVNVLVIHRCCSARSIYCVCAGSESWKKSIYCSAYDMESEFYYIWRRQNWFKWWWLWTWMMTLDMHRLSICYKILQNGGQILKIWIVYLI